MDMRAALIEIYDNRANALYGLSDVTQRQHALQSAKLALDAGEPAIFITAALLHDVGHMIHDMGEDPASAGIDDTHEELAAHWLAKAFGPEVCEPIRLHVPAKRYLCAVDPGYFGILSEDSVRSLALQGGPMSAEEVAAFEKNPHFAAAVKLRRIDDLAKDPQASTPSFHDFLPAIDAAMASKRS